MSSSASTLAMIAAAHASLAKVGRWPAGTPGAKGGQFAPGKGGAGDGGGFAWGQAAGAKPPPPASARSHPKVDDKGAGVLVHYPTSPSSEGTWSDKHAVATFVPGGKAPSQLNGVPMHSWKPPADWTKVTGTNQKIDADDPFEPHPDKRSGAGVVILEPDGRMWLTKPTNEFGGYQHSWPKGGVEPGLSLQQTAIKEAWEETGLKIKITGILGDYEGDTSKARYYVAQRVGGTPTDMGWETQAMRLVPAKSLKSLLNRKRDKDIAGHITDLLRAEGIIKAFVPETTDPFLEEELDKAGPPKGAPGAGWAKQARWPAGTPLGGQWKAYDGAGFPTPPKVAAGLEGKNPAYQKKANALYAAVTSGDLDSAKAAVDVLAAKVKANAEGGKTSYHVKWTAQVHQYGQELLDTHAASSQATAAAVAATGPTKISTWKQTGLKPGGSAPGGIFTDEAGVKWLVKGNLAKGETGPTISDMRAKNEVLAAQLLNAVGAGAPEMKLVDLGDKFGGGLGVASKWEDGLAKFNPQNKAQLAAAQHQFAVQAWLGNWDAIGASTDNTMFDGFGKAKCIDPGGALLFRAQGHPKPSGAFSSAPTDLESMRDMSKNAQTAKVYKPMTASQLAASAKMLENIDEATITKLVTAHGPGDARAKAKLTKTLIARRTAILAWGEKIAPTAPTPSAPPPTLTPSVHAATKPSASQFPVPTFHTGFEKTDAAYTASAKLAQVLHQKASAGDQLALDTLATMKEALGKGLIITTGGVQAIQEKSTSAKKLKAYLDVVVPDAASKFAAVQTQAQAASLAAAAAAKVTADAGTKKLATALPDYQAAKLAQTNTNAPSHNKKIDQIQALAANGDIAGLEAMKFGSNNYAKKQAEIANDTLSALGSSYKHQWGKEKTATLAAAPAPARGGPSPAPAAQVTAEAAPPAVKPIDLQEPSIRVPRPPDFANWKGPGVGLSSSAHVNAQNQALAKQIQDTAKTHDIGALQALQYPELDKTTGKPTGKMLPVSQHPSQHIKAYLADAIDAVKNPYVPSKKMTAEDLAAVPQVVKKILASVKDTPDLASAAKRLGRYAVLGSVKGAPFDGFPPVPKSTQIGNLDVKSLYDQSHANFAKLSATEKQAVRDYTGSGYQAQNNAETGKGSTAASHTIKALKKAAVELPEGTVLSRKFGFKTEHLKNTDALSASVGAVIKDFGIISTSTNPETWSGQIHLKISTAKGVKGLYVAPNPSGGGGAISKHPGENEIILPYGTKFFVKAVHKKPIKDKTGEWGKHQSLVVELIALPDVD